MNVSYEISGKENETGVFEIYNIIGKKLLSYPLYIGKNSFTITEESLEQGIYFYKALLGDKLISSDKIMVIK